MKYLKRVLLLFSLLTFLCSDTSASVGTGTDRAVNYEMHYPIVYTENTVAQNKINSDLYRYIENFRIDYRNGEFIEGKFTYELRFENADYVSLILHDYRWRGGVHGHTIHTGLVYNKHSGEKVPLRYFIHLVNEDFSTLFAFPLYNERNKFLNTKSRVPYRECDHTIPDDYFLSGNGIVSLIFQEYQRAAFFEGMTYTPIEPKWIDYFNRKNP